MSFRRAALPLLAGVALAAAQEAAPLAESKRALQSLEKDRAAERAKVSEEAALQLNLPALQPPSPDAPLPSSTAPAAPEPSRGAVRNWLVDGYDGLERGRDAEKDEAEHLNPNDPDYFVRLYQRQRSVAEPGRRTADQERSGAGGEGVGGAMRPFLENWLSGSPVEEALRSVVGGGADARWGREPFLASPREPMRAPPESLATGLPPSAGETPLALPPIAPQAGAATNPFVAALGLETVNVVASAPPVPNPSAPAPAAWTPPELPKPEERRPPPRPDDEARKYFPQLRKF